MDSLTTRTMPRQARSARTLDLILDAAEQSFHERGVVETSTVDVASAAGVSVGRLYYWFPDKDAVVSAVMARAAKRLREFLATINFDDPSVTVDEVVLRLVPAVGGFFRSSPGALAVLVHHGLDGDPAASLRTTFVDAVCVMLAVRNPSSSNGDARVVAESVVRVAASFYAEATRATAADAAVLTDELAQLIIAYVSKRFPAAPIGITPA